MAVEELAEEVVSEDGAVVRVMRVEGVEASVVSTVLVPLLAPLAEESGSSVM